MTYADADSSCGFTIEHIRPKAGETAAAEKRKVEEVLFNVFSKYDEAADRMDEE